MNDFEVKLKEAIEIASKKCNIGEIIYKNGVQINAGDFVVYTSHEGYLEFIKEEN